MNQAHLEFLASPEWARMLETDLLPWLASAADLGDHVLEVGPGPGLTTDLLRHRCERLTAVELDAALAQALAHRLRGTNVEVINVDARSTGLPPDSFSAATCFSMLHHVPTRAAQDEVLQEIHRILRPGGTLLVADSRDLDFIRDFHEDDVFTPLGDDPSPRIVQAGYSDVDIEVGDYEIRLCARKPAAR